MSARRPITDPTEAFEFIHAGNARVTFVSLRTGVRFTFRIKKKKERIKGEPLPLFVSLLNGPDNESSYTYIGFIPAGRRVYHFGGDKARVGFKSPSNLAFTWVYRHLSRGHMPPDVEIWHEGRCGRCGKPLTTPDSIQSGYGPVCRRM